MNPYLYGSNYCSPLYRGRNSEDRVFPLRSDLTGTQEGATINLSIHYHATTERTHNVSTKI